MKVLFGARARYYLEIPAGVFLRADLASVLFCLKIAVFILLCFCYFIGNVFWLFCSNFINF